MDVGSGRISVIQVAREPDVARETPAPAAVPPSPGRSARPTHPVSRTLSPADPPRLPDARSGRRTRPPDRADLGGARGAPGPPARPPPPPARTLPPPAPPRLPDARSARRTRSPDRADLGGARGAPGR